MPVLSRASGHSQGQNQDISRETWPQKQISCPSCVAFDLRLSESFIKRTTEDLSFFVQENEGDLSIYSNVTRLGFEIEHASGLAFEFDAGIEHLFYTNRFKDRITKYFLSGQALLNYHFFSPDRRLDFYPSLGIYATSQTDFDETQWQAILGFGWAWHFRPHPAFVYAQPALSADDSGGTIWHLTLGLGLEY